MNFVEQYSYAWFSIGNLPIRMMTLVDGVLKD